MNILVTGWSGSGKTTAARIIAEEIGGKAANASDFIIRDYAKEVGLDPKQVIEKKSELRSELYDYGRRRQAIRPSYPVADALNEANVITGLRNMDELVATRDLFDLILWIDRDDSKPSNTDRISPKDADIIVNNNGTIDELKTAIGSTLDSFRGGSPNPPRRP